MPSKGMRFTSLLLWVTGRESENNKKKGPSPATHHVFFVDQESIYGHLDAKPPGPKGEQKRSRAGVSFASQKTIESSMTCDLYTCIQLDKQTNRRTTNRPTSVMITKLSHQSFFLRARVCVCVCVYRGRRGTTRTWHTLSPLARVRASPLGPSRPTCQQIRPHTDTQKYITTHAQLRK